MGPEWIFAAAVAVVLVVATLGIAQDRRRGRAFAALGAGAGLRYERAGPSARARLGALPTMQLPGRHAAPHALLANDEVLCDWRIVARPKERPRRRIHTLLAKRERGASFAPTSEERVDDGPRGFGPYVIERSGEWVACRLVRGRVPNDRLAEFRERAGIWLDASPSGDGR